MRTLRLTLAMLTALPLIGRGIARGRDVGDPDEGHVVYERYCVSCHGERGDGKGEAAAYEDPKPRDYRPGIFKCRSTPSGTLPLQSDLERTLENGLYGTHMPSWYPIGHRARQDAIAYVQTFSKRWAEEKPGSPVPIPDEPPTSPDSVRRGRQVYEQTGCGNCHGDDGRGEGPAAKVGMTDTWGHAIAVADLTTAHFKCGSSSTDLYRSMVTGLDGTPMPSFAETLQPDQVWDVVHYVLDLGREAGNSQSWLAAIGRIAKAPTAEAAPPPPPQPLAKVVVTEEQIVALEPIRFAYASAVISSDAQPILDQVARVMAERPSVRLRVEGHTDSKGSDAYNRPLSEERARAVVAALVQKGVDGKRLRAVGFGSSRPIAANTNPDGTDNVAGQERNRRTEFHIES
jgi:outer membrane protein OmpA-like peptidoglycan-associated protein/cytochrome c553